MDGINGFAVWNVRSFVWLWHSWNCWLREVPAFRDISWIKGFVLPKYSLGLRFNATTDFVVFCAHLMEGNLANRLECIKHLVNSRKFTINFKPSTVNSGTSSPNFWICVSPQIAFAVRWRVSLRGCLFPNAGEVSGGCRCEGVCSRMGERRSRAAINTFFRKKWFEQKVVLTSNAFFQTSVNSR